ncbi:DUF4012 domain-containing protein [Nocardioides sp. SYSU DS0663]|uniref:DUF4012 domain-containing protein n=1 Tax=Nocardioides sp. SYSU DS0663 TaxID=3416445 RepID=UPI003F4B4100
MQALRSRRVLLIALGVVALALAAYAAWLAYTVNGHLRAAADDADALQSALRDGDDAAAADALAEMQVHARTAASRTDGPVWAVAGWLPVVGDDADGVAAVSQALAGLSEDGLPPLLDVRGSLEQVVAGRTTVSIPALRELQSPVASGAEAFGDAEDRLAEHDADDFVDVLATQYRQLEEYVADGAAGLRSADTALAVLPTMLGGEGPQNYLFVFQNNAEIRATGGMPGSWAVVTAEDGRVSLGQQGDASFAELDAPVLPLSEPEVALFGEELGTYWQDANFTPHFPRAAELWRARWAEEVGTVDLDGIIALDPVSMSYLLEATGPVDVAGLTLTADNVVEELLNRPYLERTPEAQDLLFAAAARAIFDAVTSDSVSAPQLVSALHRAAKERRLLVAPFDADVEERLQGTSVTGSVEPDATEGPVVDVAVNDGTGSKMSYYLRYGAEVESVSCEGGEQVLVGSMTLRQDISQAEAEALPDSVTGLGTPGVARGSQFVGIDLLGPAGGTIEEITVNGRELEGWEKVEYLDRPATSMAVLLTGQPDTLVRWTMRADAAGGGPGLLRMTPGIRAGDYASEFRTGCG